MSQVKRTEREDQIARATRIVRDRAYRAVGQDSTDPEYKAIVWSLEQVRQSYRTGV